ncbi:vesicle-associated membrane protein 4 [Teratosphaeria destructans]|uniref:Vesicle-associated membrane protein 4 n=1 Tax=Teratosphaeria destructans TaxID=418781 RepID=A0A9W7SKG5_9PEZI|nr:vesicle-associated membrane protein 4 [Teratosphaeria destructans]
MSSSQGGGLYDPYVPQGQAQGQQAAGGDRRIQNIQQEIDFATERMNANIIKTSQRGENLDQLQTKTNALSDQATVFRRGANRVRKQMWWKDMKMRMCIIVGIVILLVVIIVPSVIAAKHH